MLIVVTKQYYYISQSFMQWQTRTVTLTVLANIILDLAYSARWNNKYVGILCFTMGMFMVWQVWYAPLNVIKMISRTARGGGKRNSIVNCWGHISSYVEIAVLLILSVTFVILNQITIIAWLNEKKSRHLS